MPKGQWNCYVPYLSVSEKSVTNRVCGEREKCRGGERSGRERGVHVITLRLEVTTEMAVNKQWRSFMSQLKASSERVLFVQVQCSH